MTFATQSGDTLNRSDPIRSQSHQVPAGHIRHSAVQVAVAQVAAGGAVLVADKATPDHGGYLMVAAELVTTELVAFLVRHSSGVLCVALDEAECRRMDLPPMTRHNENPVSAAFTVSVDAAVGITTGISASDRATTIRALADPTTQPDELSRPGHVFPLRAHPGGVRHRPRFTEAAVALTQLAHLHPAAVIAALVNDDCSPVTPQHLSQFSALHGLALVTIHDLVDALGP